MNENDLRRTFGRITPDETLIRATIEKVEAQKYTAAAKAAAHMTQSTRKSSPYAIAYRLAGAACALVLMVSVGISLGKDTLLPSAGNETQSYARAQFNDTASEAEISAYSGDDPMPATTDEVVQPFALPPADTAECYDRAAIDEMAVRAAQSGDNWLILDATLSSCYILPASEDGRYGCVVAFDGIRILDMASDAQASAALFSDTTDTPAVCVYFEDEASRSALIDAMGARMCVSVLLDDPTPRMDPSYLLSK
ncbi:MAG: hypothetical protein IJW40_01490 [Clostridia bacterium]|nr:hypothetical protein [Clostridia bacterium]